MSTILNTDGRELPIPVVKEPATFSCAIVTAQWNSAVTHALRDGAVDVLAKAGVARENVALYDVPGTVELVNIAGRLVTQRLASAVIVIGCVIRGDTPHFDYVCQIVADGVASLNARGGVPVIFGVLTVETMQQALERAGGALGNKGAEAAVAAIEMHNVHTEIDNHVISRG